MFNKLNKLHKDNQNLIAHLKANIAEMEHYIDQVSEDDYALARVQYNQMRDCVSQFEQKAEYYTGFITEKIQEIWEPQTETPEELQREFFLWLEKTEKTSEQEEV